MQRKLTVIISADVAGYSGHLERDEAGTLSRLKKKRRALFDPPVPRSMVLMAAAEKRFAQAEHGTT